MRVGLQQTWAEFKGYWIGVDNDNPPHPEDLLREEIFLGNSPTFADGNQWIIPTVEFLPHRHGINHGTGEHVRRISPRFKEYSESIDFLAESMLEQMEFVEKASQLGRNVEDMEIRATLSDGWAFAVKALSINYRITDSVLDVLGIVSDEEILKIVMTAMELDEHLGTVVKKKQKDTVGASVGSLT